MSSMRLYMTRTERFRAHEALLARRAYGAVFVAAAVIVVLAVTVVVLAPSALRFGIACSAVSFAGSAAYAVWPDWRRERARTRDLLSQC